MRTLFLLLFLALPGWAWGQTPGGYCWDIFSNVPQIQCLTNNSPVSGILTNTRVASVTTSGYLVEWDTYANKWSNTSTPFNSEFTLTWGGGNQNGSNGAFSSNFTVGKRYTLQIRGLSYSNRQAVIMETTNDPINFAVSNPVSSAGTVYSNVPVNLIITLAGSKSPEEKAFLRYTTDNFATTQVIEVNFETSTSSEGTVTIPGSVNTSGTTVSYYVYTTTVSATNTSDHDLITLRLANNGGSNYSYTVLPFGTSATGAWSNTATWLAGQLPPVGSTVVLSHNVDLDQDASVGSLTINNGVTFNASHEGSRTLSIASGATITNNGTFNAGTGTINFLGSGFLRGTSTYTLNNINARGRTEIPSTATINGTLSILTGGYLAQLNSAVGVNSTDDLPNYGENSTLLIAGPFEVALSSNDRYASGWGNVGTKIPQNIILGTLGNITINSTNYPDNLLVRGTLTVQANSFITNNKLTLSPTGRITSTGTGTITGNVTIQRELPLKSVAENTGRFFAFGYPHNSGIPYRGTTGLLRNVWIQGAEEEGLGSTTSGSPNIFTYNNAYTGATPAGAWEGVTNPNITVARGQGFMAYLYDFADFANQAVNRSTLHSSVGTLSTENSSVDFSFTTLEFAANSNADLQGLNFIANPFAAPIYWHTTNLTRTHVDNGYWVVNASGTGFDAIAGDQTGDAVSIGVHQGFFVRTTAANPSLAINVNAKNPVPPSKSSSTIRVQIALENIEGQREDQSVIRFLDEESRGMNFLGALTRSYSLMYLEDEVGRKMDVIDLNMSESGVLRFPVQIATTSAGSFALAITENSLPGEWQATLVDLTNGRRYPAESGARIEFVSEASTVEAPYSRFMLELQNGEATNAEGVELPSAFVLSAPAPNPFRGATTLDLRVETAQTVTATLYDVLGREVAQLFHGDVAPGQVQQFRVNGEALNAGVYFVRVDGQTFTETRRLVRIQ